MQVRAAPSVLSEPIVLLTVAPQLAVDALSAEEVLSGAGRRAAEEALSVAGRRAAEEALSVAGRRAAEEALSAEEVLSVAGQ